jgi:hypothetical protein
MLMGGCAWACRKGQRFWWSREQESKNGSCQETGPLSSSNMSDRVPALARQLTAARASLEARVTIGRDPRRPALVTLAAVLLAVACAAPLPTGDVIGSVTFSIAFFATLLTGEAVIFVFSFAPSSAWPSLREIDSHIAFREWVVVGWLAAMLTATGLPTHAAIPAT